MHHIFIYKFVEGKFLALIPTQIIFVLMLPILCVMIFGVLIFFLFLCCLLFHVLERKRLLFCAHSFEVFLLLRSVATSQHS